MPIQVLQLEASSPEELKYRLEDTPRSSKLENKFLVLNVSGNQAIVRNFELPILTVKEIKNALRLEAVETFSLGPDEIEIDYQILSSVDGKYKGVFAAMPKSVLKDYFAQICKAGFIPLALTVKMMTTINADKTKVSSTKAFYIILAFISQKSAFLALFNEDQCELLRNISYDDIAEAKEEISNSLRYALGKSAAKNPQELYFFGDIVGGDELIANLENEFNVKSKAIDLGTTQVNAYNPEDYFKLNFIKEYTVSLILRRKLHLGLNIAMGVASLIFISAFIGSLRLDAQLSNLKKEFNPSQKAIEYNNKIKNLQEKIKLLENEK